MTPEEKKEFEEMKRTIQSLKSAAGFDPLIAQAIIDVVGNMNLNDLNDVQISGVSDDEVLKYYSTGGYWRNEADAV